MWTFHIPASLEDEAVGSMPTRQSCPPRLMEFPGAFQPRMDAGHPNLTLYTLQPCILALRQTGWASKGG